MTENVEYKVGDLISIANGNYAIVVSEQEYLQHGKSKRTDGQILVKLLTDQDNYFSLDLLNPKIMTSDEVIEEIHGAIGVRKNNITFEKDSIFRLEEMLKAVEKL
ncbi:MAG: hypothetical protein WC413_01115 [Candidatus Nanoarchaeia archaeon]